jgi:hypothetical protein
MKPLISEKHGNKFTCYSNIFYEKHYVRRRANKMDKIAPLIFTGTVIIPLNSYCIGICSFPLEITHRFGEINCKIY